MLMMACTNDSVVEEQNTTSTDPLRFTSLAVAENSDPLSRADNIKPLTTGFMVSCWNDWENANAKKPSVMEDYTVEYRYDGWSNQSKWEYANVDGQYLKYWDYSHFPYRFHAIAPCPADKTGFTLEKNNLHISGTFTSQTCTDGTLTPDTVQEPYMIAQLQRNYNGKDWDIFTGKEMDNASPILNRWVVMPFHHINSKIRFGVYHTTSWATSNKLYIKGLTIKVTSTGYGTEAKAYKATDNSDSWRSDKENSGFEWQTTTDTKPTIFTFTGGESVEGNDLTLCQSKETAYMLLCPDGMVQLPQKDIQMTVSFDLYYGDGVYMHFSDVPIRIDDESDHLEWISGYLHTYYLVIGEIDDKLEITFTATLTPWEDVDASLNTDLEK